MIEIELNNVINVINNENDNFTVNCKNLNEKEYKADYLGTDDNHFLQLFYDIGSKMSVVGLIHGSIDQDYNYDVENKTIKFKIDNNIQSIFNDNIVIFLNNAQDGKITLCLTDPTADN